MSVAHRSQRPKGFMHDWTPNPRSAELIDQVKQVIRASTFEISVRFIFYRLVAHGYPKTERDYKNLVELLVKARRAELIPFHAIADSDPALAGGSWGYQTRAEFLRGVKTIGERFKYDPTIGQPFEIELWSEDAGSVPMLAGIARDYPITIYSTGGFSSVTVTHAIAQRVIRREVPTIFLHIGDFDPSGESIFKSMSQDAGAFVSDELGCDWDDTTGQTYCSPDDDGPDFRPIRVALTRDQAEDWSLETAPPKATDSRSRNWIGGTVQVQAMSEEQMRDTVTAALDDYIDHDKMQELEDKAAEKREEMAPLISSAMESVITELGDGDDE